MRSASGRSACAPSLLENRSVNARARSTHDVPVFESLAPAAGASEADQEADDDSDDVGADIQPFRRAVADEPLAEFYQDTETDEPGRYAPVRATPVLPGEPDREQDRHQSEVGAPVLLGV